MKITAPKRKFNLEVSDEELIILRIILGGMSRNSRKEQFGFSSDDNDIADKLYEAIIEFKNNDNK